VPLENTGRTITAIRALKNSVRISFGDQAMSISHQRYTDRYLYVGKTLPESEYQQLLDDAAIGKLESYAQRLLAKGLYTQKQIKDKLYAKQAKRWMVEAILQQLASYQLIDDARYVQERLEYGHARLEGFDRILDDLKNKGIDEKYLRELVYDEKLEFEKASSLWPRVIKLLAKKSQLARHHGFHDFYSRRGYRHELINRVIDELDHPSIEEDMKNLKRDYQTAKRKYMHEKGRKLRDRLVRYLASKGYNYSNINMVLGEQDDGTMD